MTGGPDLAWVREQFLNAVYDPHDPYTATDVPYRLLDAMARMPRAVPAVEPSPEDRVTAFLAELGLSIFPTETVA